MVTKPLKCASHGSDDIVTARPGSVQQLGEQPTLAGSNSSTIHDDIELALPTLLELDRLAESFLDHRSETRCLCRGSGSCVAIHDSDGHVRKYTAPYLRIAGETTHIT